MSLKVVVGAGSTGVATAVQLADAGEEVRLITRRGSGPEHAGIERIAADAYDTGRLAELARGATTVFNTAMPAYNRWPEEFPALAASVLSATEQAGADYVLLGNLYGYGPVTGALTTDHPLVATTRKGRVRTQLWQDALTAHEAGRVRVTEVRASDFLGVDAVAWFVLAVVPPVLAGEGTAFFGDPGQAHAWTYTGDAARTLIAASNSDQAWGRAWHAPSTSHASARELAARLAEIAGVAPARVDAMTAELFDQLAAADPVIEELREMAYNFDNPLVVDASATEQALGVTATPLDEVLIELVKSTR